MNNSSIGKKAVSVILALLLGVCVSGAIGVIMPGGIFLSALSVFSSMLLAFLFGFGGFLPATVMAVTMLVSGYVVGGWVIPAYLLIIGIFPGAVMIYSSHKGIKFFGQVRNAMIVELIAFVLLLGAMRYLTGQDFASFFKQMYDEMIASLPPEAKEGFAEYLNQLINPQNSPESAVNTENVLAFFSDGMEQTLSLMMPVALVVYSVMNGAIGVLWMNWIRQRHGEENVQFVPLRGWRLSKQITLGLLIVFIAVLIIGKRAAETGVSAQIMAGAAIFCAACIQASASFLSRLTIMGLSAKKRTLFLVLFFILTSFYFPYYGMMSALFGSKGLLTPKRRFVNRMGNFENTDVNPTDETDETQEDDNDKEDK